MIQTSHQASPTRAMDISDEESYPTSSVGASEQLMLQARTSVESQEADLRVVKAASKANQDKAAACITGGSSVTETNFGEEIEEQQDNEHKQAIKRKRLLNDILKVSPFDDQECKFAKNCPYVPMNVDEVSVVESLMHWTNPNVRVIGRIVPINSSCTLCGVGEDQGEISLNVQNLNQYPKHGDIVEVFGTLYIDKQCIYQNDVNSSHEQGSQIKLKVMFFRSLLDVSKYKKGLSLMKPYIPLFVRRD